MTSREVVTPSPDLRAVSDACTGIATNPDTNHLVWRYVFSDGQKSLCFLLSKCARKRQRATSVQDSRLSVRSIGQDNPSVGPDVTSSRAVQEDVFVCFKNIVAELTVGFLLAA
jgi:hypothetical protein